MDEDNFPTMRVIKAHWLDRDDDTTTTANSSTRSDSTTPDRREVYKDSLQQHASTTPHICRIVAGQRKNQPKIRAIKYDGWDWKRQPNGQWLPPQTQPTAPNIHNNPTPDTHSEETNKSTINTARYKYDDQTDSGANRIVTDDLSRLRNVVDIPSYPIGGCNKENGAALICTKKGILDINTEEGIDISVEAYYILLQGGRWNYNQSN